MASLSTIYAMHTVDNPSIKKAPIVNSIGKPKDPVEKEFDRIRKYESYDPATNIWSRIEDFKTVEILEDTSVHRNEHYIYFSFWAYDAQQKRWKRVDVRDYGHRYGKSPIANPIPEAIAEEAVQEEKEDSNKKNKQGFWKNLGVTFAAGGGGTYFHYQVSNIDLYVKKGDKKFYLQPINSSDTQQNKAHLIEWFDKRYTKALEFVDQNVAYDKKSFEHYPNKGNLYLQAFGFNIPITLGLHYTFFNRLRIGVGGNLEVNYVKHIKPKGDAVTVDNYNVPNPWVYNVKPFGTLAYKVYQTDKNSVVLDTQIGAAFDLGTSPRENLTSWVRGPGLYVSLGIAHEVKLNDYFKFFYRLAIDGKKYKDKETFHPTNGSVDIYQPGVHLEIGTILNFGRDIDDEEESDGSSIDNSEVLSKVGQTVSETEDKLHKAEEAKRKAQSAKNTLKGLFK
jgi:heme-degrading monooxygenase HmoA